MKYKKDMNQYEFAVYDYYNQIEEPNYALMPKEVFNWACYSRWACDQVFEKIQSNQRESPIYIVESFSREMEDYASVNPRLSFIFRPAEHMCHEIITIFNDMAGEV